MALNSLCTGRSLKSRFNRNSNAQGKLSLMGGLFSTSEGQKSNDNRLSSFNEMIPVFMGGYH